MSIYDEEEEPRLNLTYEHLQEQHPDIKAIYDRYGIAYRGLHRILRSKVVTSGAKIADGVELIEKELKTVTDKVQTLSGELEEDTRRMFGEFADSKGVETVTDASAAIEYLQTLSTGERVAALKNSKELRGMVSRFESLFGAYRIKEIKEDLETAFRESSGRELSGMRETLKVLEELHKSFGYNLRSILEDRTGTSWEQAVNIQESRYEVAGGADDAKAS